MNKTIKQILDSKFSTADKMVLIKQYRKECSRMQDTIYEFFRNHLKDDQSMLEFARKHYDSHLSNDSDYTCFEDWFNGCVYDMSGDCWKEGVESWLGELKYKDEFDKYLDSINFQEFIDNLDYNCEVHFGYSDGIGFCIDPTIHIDVELLNF